MALQTALESGGRFGLWGLLNAYEAEKSGRIIVRLLPRGVLENNTAYNGKSSERPRQANAFRMASAGVGGVSAIRKMGQGNFFWLDGFQHCFQHFTFLVGFAVICLLWRFDTIVRPLYLLLLAVAGN